MNNERETQQARDSVLLANDKVAAWHVWLQAIKQKFSESGLSFINLYKNGRIPLTGIKQPQKYFDFCENAYVQRHT